MTQVQTVLKHLKRKSITSAEAYHEYGIARLASRITDIKNMGIAIRAKRIKVINRHGKECTVCKYFLDK